jgi:hypothetical protein
MRPLCLVAAGEDLLAWLEVSVTLHVPTSFMDKVLRALIMRDSCDNGRRD